ncbi:MAG: hypothetical protein JOZ81_18500 [Chloroflexi bacterium]|nr:hypothetical protein [Chloroflexota bacterium]
MKLFELGPLEQGAAKAEEYGVSQRAVVDSKRRMGLENRGALFAVAVPLIAFKIWFAILLLMYAPTRDTAVWIAATHWTLIIVIGILVVAGIPMYRLMRARARRNKLRRSEWMVDAPPQCSALWETVSRLEGGD